MKPTGEQIGRLQAALVMAYDYAGLRQMLRMQLNQDVEAIAVVTAANLNDIVFAVIRHYAAQTGGLHRLVTADRTGNPGNPRLAVVAEELLAIAFEPDAALRCTSPLLTGDQVAEVCAASPSRPAPA